MVMPMVLSSPVLLVVRFCRMRWHCTNLMMIAMLIAVMMRRGGIIMSMLAMNLKMLPPKTGKSLMT